MGIVYRDASWFIKGCSDFVDDIAFEKVKVQLGLSVRVEGEATYFAVHFSILGSVVVILVTGGSKLNDVVPGLQFVDKIAEIIARGWQTNSKWPPIKVQEIVMSPATTRWVRRANWEVDGMGG